MKTQMAGIPFTKMHGTGNDYIYINCFDFPIRNPEQLAVEMSCRHTSVGADGLVLVCPSEIADAKMRMFNADGSEGRMCGNAIRCVGKLLYDSGRSDKTELRIETLSGIKLLQLFCEDGKVHRVMVDMGFADFDPGAVPVGSTAEMIDSPVTIMGKNYRLTALSMGNPHAVVFMDDICHLPLHEIGPAFEHSDLFPERVNTEFVERVDDKTLCMRVWERGSGETRACGTGACAAVAAAVRLGICKSDESITVNLAGGKLSILCTKDYHLTMTGEAKKVYDGVYLPG